MKKRTADILLGMTGLITALHLRPDGSRNITTIISGPPTFGKDSNNHRLIKESMSQISNFFPNQDIKLFIFDEDIDFNEINTNFYSIDSSFRNMLHVAGFRVFELNKLSGLLEMLPMDRLGSIAHCNKALETIGWFDGDIHIIEKYVYPILTSTIKTRGKDNFKRLQKSFDTFKKYVTSVKLAATLYRGFFTSLLRMVNVPQPKGSKKQTILLKVGIGDGRFKSKMDYDREIMTSLSASLMRYTGLNEASDLYVDTKAIYQGKTYFYAPIGFRSLARDPEYLFLKNTYQPMFSNWRLFFTRSPVFNLSDNFYFYLYYVMEKRLATKNTSPGSWGNELLPPNSDMYKEMVAIDIASKIISKQDESTNFLKVNDSPLDKDWNDSPLDKDLIEDIKKTVQIIPGSVNMESLSNIFRYYNELLLKYTVFPLSL